jgi:hypothetical protein
MKNRKKDDLIKCLDQTGCANIYFFNKYTGADIPKYLKEESDATILKLSNDFAFPLHFKEDVLEAKLSFKGQYYECTIPYESILFIAGSNPNSFCQYYQIDFSKQDNIKSAMLAEIEEDDENLE